MADNHLTSNLIIENRRKTTVSGVTDVDSFDDKTLCVYTSQGRITFRGEGLHIASLSLEIGEVSFDGRVDGITYRDGVSHRNESFIKRLFR